MTPLQQKLLGYDHGYFMAAGLGVFILGFMLRFSPILPELNFVSMAAMVLGALTLGYGTGHCDQKTCSA